MNPRRFKNVTPKDPRRAEYHPAQYVREHGDSWKYYAPSGVLSINLCPPTQDWYEYRHMVRMERGEAPRVEE